MKQWMMILIKTTFNILLRNLTEKQTKFEKKQGEKTITAFVPDVVNSEKEGGESSRNKLMVS